MEINGSFSFQGFIDCFLIGMLMIIMVILYWSYYIIPVHDGMAISIVSGNKKRTLIIVSGNNKWTLKEMLFSKKKKKMKIGVHSTLHFQTKLRTMQI